MNDSSAIHISGDRSNTTELSITIINAMTMTKCHHYDAYMYIYTYI